MSWTPLNTRAPGSFSPMISTTNSTRAPVRRVESSDSESNSTPQSFSNGNNRAPPPAPSNTTPNALPRPLYANSNANSSSSSLQNFSRPNPTPLRTDLARTDLPLRNVSPLTITPSPKPEFQRGHSRKHSHTQGSFEAYLPTAANSNLANMAQNTTTALSASQIAAQAAMQHQTLHMRQRSMTVPAPHMGDGSSSGPGSRKISHRGPISPPMLSLTEASAPKDSAFGGQVYHNGLLAGPNTSAAQTAANVVFPKSPGSSPGLTPVEYEQRMHPDKPIKTEKSKVKLFSRPGKIGTSKDKTGGSNTLPSPNSMSSAASLYSMANSSAATIRGIEQPEKEKDKKHHFLSRQKHKLSSKDEFHLPLSSAASNSKPVDPSAPSSLYHFNLPPSPGPNSTSFSKSVSGLDLRHGGRALRERKKEEKSESMRESNELSYQNSNDWAGPSSLGSASVTSGGGALGPGYQSSIYGGSDMQESARYGLNSMTPDDAWPFLKAKLLIIFEGDDLRLPVEDFNRLVTTHLQRSIQKRQPNLIVEDLRDFLTTGFGSLDQTLRRTPDERLIPDLVAMWLFTFTSILPYMQAVFLPLDLEFAGNGPLMTAEQARDFWGVLPTPSSNLEGRGENIPVLEVRTIVLTAYRDTVILPRFDTLKQIFSRLSLESISLPLPSPDVLSTSPDSLRPGTAMSLDPSTASYSSQSTTLLGGGSSGDGSGNRSRAISNVSYTSDPASTSSGLGINSNNIPYPPRPFTPSSTHPIIRSAPVPSASSRSQTVEDSSKRLTETVGRMLQCMSVLSSASIGAGGNEDEQAKMEELTRGLKLNWLGRGRMGRDRRGLVGGRVTAGVGAGNNSSGGGALAGRERAGSGREGSML